MNSEERYNALLASGFMFEFYPELTGNYQDDFAKWQEIERMSTCTK